MKRTYRALALAGALAAGGACAADPPAGCRPTDLASGEPVDLADYRGKVLYVDFWASWCVPCRKTFPFMNALHDELAAEGLHILAVSVDMAPEDAQAFLEQFPADFQVAIDPTPACPTAFEVLGVPSSFILGRDGTVLHRHTGFSESDPEELRAQVREALR